MAVKRRKKYKPPLDKDFGRGDTETKMQLSGNSSQPEPFAATLVDLRRGDAAILDRIAKNESLLNMARERAAGLSEAFKAQSKP